MSDRDLVSETAQIVSSHVGNNSVRPDQLTMLIRDVYRTLTTLRPGEQPATSGGQPSPEPESQKRASSAPETEAEGGWTPSTRLNPAVDPKRSVFPDFIVCLEDGKRLKTMKRHLATAYGLTPDQYRDRWGLPPDYPMVAPNYAATRSQMALNIGLGRKGRGNPPSRTKPAEPEPANDAAPRVRRVPEGVSGRKRGRPRRVA